jgi:uncharacterized membrane protein
MVTSWPWMRQREQDSRLPPDRAAERVESYVYGNVLVLAALAAVGVDDVQSGRAALLVLGTAISTFVAHLLAVSVGHGTRGSASNGEPFRQHARDALPIATSGLVPAVCLLLGWWGWIPPEWSMGLAIGTSVLRLVLLGSVVSYLNGEHSTWKNALIGFGLGVAGLVVAGVKFFLTH